MIKNFTVNPEDMSIKSIKYLINKDDNGEDVYDVRPFFDSLPDFKDKLAEALIYMGCGLFPDTEIEIKFSWEGYYISILGGEISYVLRIDTEEEAIDEVSLSFLNKNSREIGEEIFHAVSHINVAYDMKTSLGIALQKRLKKS